MLKKICLAFVSRSETQGWKGKKRDEAAINFFAGAISMLGEKDAKPILAFTVFGLSIRGYKAIETYLLIDSGVQTTSEGWS